MMPDVIWMKLAHGATACVSAELVRGVYPFVILEPVRRTPAGHHALRVCGGIDLARNVVRIVEGVTTDQRTQELLERLRERLALTDRSV